MANRRVQGGGNPAQGRPRDVLSTVPSDADVESFPDVPPGNRSGAGEQQHRDDHRDDHPDDHRVDLDAFAERMGLRDENGAEGADGDAIEEARQRAVAAARSATGSITHSATGVATGMTDRALGTAGGLLHGIAGLMGATSRRLDRIANRIDRR